MKEETKKHTWLDWTFGILAFISTLPITITYLAVIAVKTVFIKLKERLWK